MRLRRLPALAVIAGLALPVVTPLTTRTAPAVAAATINAALTRGVEGRMANSTASTYGVVVDIAGVGRVVDIRGGSALLPASTQKLFTSLPFLLANPGRRFATTVGAAVRPTGGVVRGDLVVTASADPTLLIADLTALAKQVRAAGVSRVTGRLVLRYGSLPTLTRRSGWKSSFVPDELGPLSPFPVSYDTWQHSATYLAHPTAGNLTKFRAILAGAGVHVVGANAYVRTASAPIVFATHSSNTVGVIIRKTLTDSVNFFAEQLLSIEGQATVARAATAAGVTGTSTDTDGSGLSSQDRQTARGEVAVLAYAHSSAKASQWLFDAMPVACESGTLLHLMCGTVAAHEVFAKTGTLDHVKALSGYTTDAQGRFVTFAILASGVSNLSAATKAIDNVAILLRGFNG